MSCDQLQYGVSLGILQAVAQRDVAYENIMSQPLVELLALAEALDIAQQVFATCTVGHNGTWNLQQSQI